MTTIHSSPQVETRARGAACVDGDELSDRELADFLENAVIGLHRVGADGTILRTADGGRTWRHKNGAVARRRPVLTLRCAARRWPTTTRVLPEGSSSLAG